MTIGFIGAGNMGTALCKAFLSHEKISEEDIIVCDHSEDKLSVLSASLGVKTTTDISKIMDVNFLILAVKPQGIQSLSEEISEKINVDTVLISVLAGTTIHTLDTLLHHKKIVRAMPNTPALVNKGVIGWYANNEVNPDEKGVVQELLQSAGSATELASEELIDEVAAISGCGPGFFFALVDAWQKGTSTLELPENMRKKMLMETLEGSLELLRQSDDSPSELAEKVASKGGATEKGLEVLKEANIEKVFSDMIEAAHKRCKELG